MDINEDLIKDILFDMCKDDIKQKRRRVPWKAMSELPEKDLADIDAAVLEWSKNASVKKNRPY